VLVAAAYLVLYAALGGGARESGDYFSPFASPAHFAAAGAERLPVLLANAFLGIPAEFATIGAAPVLVALGLAASAAIAVAWRATAPFAADRERAAVRWLVPAAIASLAAGLGAFPGARLLEIPDLGFAVLIAVILRHAFARGRSAGVRRGVGVVLAAVHLGLAPLAGLANIANVVAIRRKTEAAANEARAAIGRATRALVVAASDPMVGVYAGITLGTQPDAPAGCWAWITATKADVRVTRTSAEAIAIEPLGRTLMRGAFETLYRDPSIPFHEGDGATVCGAAVRVLRVDGGRPAAVELRIDRLDAPDVALLAWQSGALSRLVLPAVGASTVVPWSPGPMGVY
jgi:hypothetical protein